MRPRTELAVAVGLCVAAGTLLTLTGGPTAHAWGWVALAGVVAIAATRGLARRAVGVLLVLAGLAVLGAHPFGAGLLVGAGALVAVRGQRWAAMGSRYDAPRVRDDPWAALDRGDDPTV